MAGEPQIRIGERLSYFRKQRGKKQALVAGLCGVTTNYLSDVERGLRTPSMGLLHRLAAELAVPVAVLLQEAEPVEGPPGRDGFGPVERALVGILPAATTAEDVHLVELRERVNGAWRTYQSSGQRFSAVAQALPELLADVDSATRLRRSPAEARERRQAQRIAADLFFLMRSYCKRLGRMDLSLLAADRGTRAAQEADDPLRIAGAAWNLGHHLLADGELDGAELVARQAADGLGDWRRTPDTAALYGALQLVLAATESRRCRVQKARAVLDGPATAAAAVSGESNVLWTAFGPSNVGVHRAFVEMEAGEAASALQIADSIDTSAMTSIERRVSHLLDVTRCYEQRRNDPAVLVHLQRAERLAPEDVRGSVLARELVRGLQHRARPSNAADVAELAARVGLLAN